MSYKWKIPNEEHRDIIGYMFHLKFLNSISQRHNYYLDPVYQSKYQLYKKKKNEETKRVETEIKSNLKTIETSREKKLLDKIKLFSVDKSPEFKRDFELYRRLEKDRLIKSNKHLMKKYGYHQTITKRIVITQWNSNYNRKNNPKSELYLHKI